MARAASFRTYLEAEFSYHIGDHGIEFVEQFAGIGASNACAQRDDPEGDYYQNLLDTVGEYTGKDWPEAQKVAAFNIADHAFSKAGGTQ